MGPLTIDQIRSEPDGELYPRDRLAGCETALMLFCAAFGGRQDCIWVADAGIAGTGVDLDGERLAAMADLYPDTWTFAEADVWNYAARRYAEGATYDLVSLDPPSNLFDWVVGAVDLWCGLADRLVVIGTSSGFPVTPPAGWEQTDRRLRSTRNGTIWVTLERSTE